MAVSLSERVKQTAEKIWAFYLSQKSETGYKSPDADRRARLPEIRKLLDDFVDGRISIADFRSAIDSESKRHNYWGFKAINGQMFFNMLTKVADAGNRTDELASCLRKVIVIPADLEAGLRAISRLSQLAEDLGFAVTDRRSAPRPRSTPYFLSYFWQIQDPEKWPIYYKSMIEALDDTGIWIPHGEMAQDYSEFHEINFLLLDFLSKIAGHPLHLWDLEHAFWVLRQKPETTPAASVQGVRRTSAQTLETQFEAPSDSYMPPIVGSLPNLAANDSMAQDIAARTGRSVEKLFEERLAVLFRMLGYQTEGLGQGKGRVPDGIAMSLQYHYAIIFDAKAREGGYSFSTDDRALREYIANSSEQLKRRGIRDIYLLLVSSGFAGDYDEVIRSMKLKAGVREVVLAEASALLAVLERRLRDPDIDLGPDGIQQLFANSGKLTRQNVFVLLGE